MAYVSKARLGKPYKETVVGVPRFVPAVRGLQSNQNVAFLAGLIS